VAVTDAFGDASTASAARGEVRLMVSDTPLFVCAT
jgi:hypothetical protein